MPEYLHPGVYIEEIESGPRPDRGVATSTAAFLARPNAVRCGHAWSQDTTSMYVGSAAFSRWTSLCRTP